MGDVRFRAVYERFASAPDRLAALRAMKDYEVLYALAGAGEAENPLLANVLATEALNRQQRARADGAALTLTLVLAISLVFAIVSLFAIHPENWPDEAIFFAVVAALGLALIGGYVRRRRPSGAPKGLA